MTLKQYLTIFLFCLVAVLLVLPATSFALGYEESYKITTSIPGTDIIRGGSIKGITLASYIATLYRGALALVGLTAFIMIVYWGFMYVFAAGNTSKTAEAKSGIFQAILGIILLLAGFLILQFINPDLADIKQLDNRLNDPTFNIKNKGQSGGSGGNSDGVIPCGSGTCSSPGYVCINTASGPACQPTGGSMPGYESVTTQVPCGSGVCSPGYVCGSTASGPACFPPGDMPKTSTVVISDTTFPMSQPSAPPDPKLLQACKDAGRIAERAPLAIGGTKCVTYCLAKNDPPRNPKCLD